MSKVRLSNIELLRCLAMFFIIAVHANYWLLGIPTNHEVIYSPIPSFTRIFLEQICIVGVDIFVLISGWFGIRPSKKGFLSFIFQIFFFKVCVYGFGLCFGFSDFSIKKFAYLFLFGKGDWFIKAYIALYLLSPALNAYVEKVNKCTFIITLIALFSFLFIYGWTGSAAWVMQGYSVFSFICLYLLARFLHIYEVEHLNGNWGLLVYISSVLIATVIGFAGCAFPILSIATHLMISYVNPLVVCGALGLFIFFAKLNISYVPIINKIGKSSFAVYLFPSYFIFNYIYKNLILCVYDSYVGGG